MKKSKLNAFIASILSLGVISCSGSAFASSCSGGANNPKPNPTEVEIGDSEDSIDFYNDFVKPYMSSGWLYESKGLIIEEILGEVKKGKLGEIEEELYRLPTGREFCVYMAANRELMHIKVRYWHRIIDENSLETERERLAELFEIAYDSLDRFDKEWPNIVPLLKLPQN